jgi:hypothetical protein
VHTQRPHARDDTALNGYPERVHGESEGCSGWELCAGDVCQVWRIGVCTYAVLRDRLGLHYMGY